MATSSFCLVLQNLFYLWLKCRRQCLSFLDNRWVIALQFHAAVPCILLGSLWILSARYRWRKERHFRKLGGLFNRHNEDDRVHGSQLGSLDDPLPKLSVILPVRGLKLCSRENWENIVEQHYDGPIEFLFVVHSKQDSAYDTIHAIYSSLNDLKASPHGRTARIIVSGESRECSQKIHNLLVGIASAAVDSQYTLLLDDDITLHPNSLVSLVHDMEIHRSIRITTGYPFDVPVEANADVLTYAALSYHLPLVIGFSLGETTQFVWGGCMLLRTQELQQDAMGIQKAWREGGYSDDLIVASICETLNIPVYCPSYGIFPQWIDPRYSMKKYWNYLRRQLYVLDTYSSTSNRITNYSLAALHCYGSWGYCIPLYLVAAHALIGLITVALDGVVKVILHVTALEERHKAEALSFFYSNDLSQTNSYEEGKYMLEYKPSKLYIASSVSFCTLSCYMMFGLWLMTLSVLDLMSALNPDLKSKRLRHRIDWFKMWIGFVFTNTILPLCMVYTFLTDHIEWAGVIYRRKQGKVVSVDHGLLKPNPHVLLRKLER